MTEVEQRTSYGEDSVLDLMSKDIKANDASKAKMTQVMTEKDYFTDLDDTLVLGIAGLLSLNRILDSRVLDEFIIQFIKSRKSRKGGRSRKDLVEMFKSLREETEGRFRAFQDKFSGLFS